MKRRRPSRHYRRVQTKKGIKRVLVNPKIKKARRRRPEFAVKIGEADDEPVFAGFETEKQARVAARQFGVNPDSVFRRRRRMSPELRKLRRKYGEDLPVSEFLDTPEGAIAMRESLIEEGESQAISPELEKKAEEKSRNHSKGNTASMKENFRKAMKKEFSNTSQKSDRKDIIISDPSFDEYRTHGIDWGREARALDFIERFDKPKYKDYPTIQRKLKEMRERLGE